MKAIARTVRLTPRKLNLIAGLIRDKSADDALNILKFTPKKGAKLLNKVVFSAVSNAENNFKQERESLYIKEIVVTKGTTMKRSVPVSRGRMHPILKRSSHVLVTIGVREKAKKAEGKKTSPKETQAAVKAEKAPKAKKAAAKAPKTTK
jgi:large subunit ribosomal protein L22